MRAMVWGHRRHTYTHNMMRSVVVLGPLPLLAVMLAGVVGLSLAFAVAVTVLAMMVGAAVVVGTLGVVGYGTWKLVQHTTPLLAGHEAPMIRQRKLRLRAIAGQFTVDTPVDALRRRFAAGEIGQHEFRRGLVELVKARYVRGDLTLDEFESRVRHIYQDPALFPPTSSLS